MAISFRRPYILRLQWGSAAVGEGQGAGGDYPRLTDLLRLCRHRTAVRELKQRGVTFTGKPHLIARMEDNDLWVAFFHGPDGNILVLMHVAPKGYTPAPV